MCADPFKAQWRQTTNNFLDQLVTLKEGWHKDGGGYHIKLLFDPSKLAKVDEGRSQALPSLLLTEQMLARLEIEQARAYFNTKVEESIEKGYLVEPHLFEGDLEGKPRCFQPYSFPLKDEEKLQLGKQEKRKTSSPPPRNPLGPDKSHNIKARLILDASADPLPGGESVNSSQLDLPDIHTLKISQILLKLRTAKRSAMEDVSEFFFRLHVDPTTTSMARVLFRRGGLGSCGGNYELLTLVSEMGLK